MYALNMFNIKLKSQYFSFICCLTFCFIMTGCSSKIPHSSYSNESAELYHTSKSSIKAEEDLSPLTKGAANADVDPNTLKKSCQAILGDHQGAIIVIDFEDSLPVIVVNPEIAYSRTARPGSVFKLVTAASLLENQLLNPQETQGCKGTFSFGGKDYLCSQIGGHGSVNLVDAISSSCSVYFFKNSLRLSPQMLEKTGKGMGFGRVLPVELTPLPPAEGVCSPPVDPRQFMKFSEGDHEGILITPYHLANMLSIVVSGSPLKNCKGEFISLKPETRELLKRGMTESSKRGTCSEMSRQGIEGGGKTGTSTNDRIPGKTHAWFVGFFPTLKPKYGVVVFLEDGRGSPDAVSRGVSVMKILKQSVRQ